MIEAVNCAALKRRSIVGPALLLVQACSAGKVTGAGGMFELPPAPPTAEPFPPTALPPGASSPLIAPVHAGSKSDIATDKTTGNGADAENKPLLRKRRGFGKG
jgi:hypothetical protein